MLPIPNFPMLRSMNALLGALASTTLMLASLLVIMGGVA